jgi:hypothetical protein
VLVVAVLLAIGSAGAGPAAGQAQAPTRYVSPGGDDRGAGSAAAPWRTLAHALGRLQAGDSLVVRGGTYRERVTGVALAPGTQDRPVRVTAAPGERPELVGILHLDAPDHWLVSGLNVRWDDSTGKSDEHMVRILNGVGWTFADAEVAGARSYAAVLVAGTVAGRPADWTLRGNCIHDTMATNDRNQDQLVYVNSGLAAGPGHIERNILFAAHNGAGIKLGGPSPDEGGSAMVTVEFNTVYDTTQSLLISGGSHGNVVRRNIFQGLNRADGVVRTFRLSAADNTLADNAAAGASRLQFSDPGYRAMQEAGNRFPLAPRFDSVSGCGGFRPQNPGATAYGRHADSTAPPAPASGGSSRTPVVVGGAAVAALAVVAVVARRRR